MRDEADASRGSRSRATTKSSEDYLEAILVIRRLRGSCRNVDIAERMGVAKPSVTKALGNLARRGLAEVVGRDVRLTEEGGRLAEATLDKHRFFERLLVETLSATDVFAALRGGAEVVGGIGTKIEEAAARVAASRIA